MTLQDTFYLLGIIFMGLMLLMFTLLIVAVFVIRAKINAIHHAIERKLDVVGNIVSAGSSVVSAVKKAADKHS